MKKVYIGVGHGGSESGAVFGGLLEKNLNLSVAKQVNLALIRSGVDTRISRSDDQTHSLPQKAKDCNAYGPDLCMDIHFNAGGGDGAEIFRENQGGKSKEFAEKVLNAIVALGQNSRGVKTRLSADGKSDWFGFIRLTNAPAILIEVAFIDTNDISFADTEEKRRAIGEAIAKGTCETLGVKYISENKQTAPDPTPSPTPLKSNEEMAKEVIAGEWGNQPEREKKLTKAGYDYNAIQKIVNEKLDSKNQHPTPAPPPTPLKSNEEMAKEVIAGEWGNQPEREKKLTKAGYDYKAIQKIVNKKLGIK
jgi:N-acetylmuramoyl-L-alanine amidase